MKMRNYLPAAGAVLVVAVMLAVAPLGRGSAEAQKRYRVADVLSTGDEVAIDAIPEGTRIIVAPDDSFWRSSSMSEGGIERGVVTGVYEDYVSIRLSYQRTNDPLAPSGKTRQVNLPVYTIARITTFVDAGY